MSHSPLAAALLALVLTCFGAGTGAAAEVSYDAQIATARNLAAEGSHAAARAAYAGALTLAADEEQRNWSRLWILAEEVAEHPSFEKKPRLREELTALFSPYEKSARTRDGFWAAAKTVEADLEYPGSEAGLRALWEAASFWAGQPVSVENEASFVDAAARLGRTLTVTNFGKLNPHLSESLALLRQAAGRPKLALLYARALEQQLRFDKNAPTAITAAYEAAVLAAKGTPDETEALLLRARWTTRRGPLAANGSYPVEFSPNHEREKISAEAFSQMLQPLDAALSAVSGLSLPRDLRVVADGLSRHREELTKPSLQIDSSQAYLPTSRFAFGITARHVGEIAFELHRVSLADLYPMAIAPKRAAVPAALEGATPLLRWSLSTGLGHDLGQVRLYQSRQRALPPGAYILIARGVGGRSVPPAMQWFLVTSAQAHAQRGAKDALEIFAYESETGKLLPSVSGRVWQGGESTAISSAEAGHGRAALPAAFKSSAPVAIIGEADGQPFALPQFYSYPENHHDEWLFHLFADRPLYEPGETAQWKLTVRQRTLGEMRVPSGTRLKIAARLGDGPPLATWEMKLNALGSAAGTLAIPALAAPGLVEFETTTFDGKDEIEHTIAAFSVDHFRAPETSLVVEPNDVDQVKRAHPGGQVELKFIARYFSGEPLAHAAVAATVRFTRQSRNFAETKTREPEAGRIPDPKLFSLETDARGVAVWRVPLPIDLPPNARLDVEAHLNAAGTTAAAQFGFDLLAAGFAAEIAPASQVAATPQSPDFDLDRRGLRLLYAVPQQPVPLAVFTWDGRAAPVAAKGHLRISRQTWEEIWRTPDNQLLSGAALRTRQRGSPSWPSRAAASMGNWELVHEGYRTEDLGVVEINTDATGHRAFQLPPLEVGYYEIGFEAEPSPPASGPLDRIGVMVADATTRFLPYHTAIPRVIPCLDEHEPGKPLRALVVLPEVGRQAVVSLRTGTAGETRTESFADNTRLLEFPWQAGYWAGARLDVAALGVDTGESGGASLKIAREVNTAKVTLSPETESPRPGEKTRLHLHTADATGVGIPSEIALSVADASVTSLVAAGQHTLADTFLQAAVILPPNFSRSERAAFYGEALAADSGVVVNPFDAEPASLDVNDRVLLSPFTVASAFDVGYKAMSTLAGSRMGAGFSASKVRSAFSAAAFWMPDVKTDRHGDATVEFTYPDNLTAWHINAEAVAEGNRFGDAQTRTHTSLPLQARLRAPRALVAGDTVKLWGVVVNRAEEPVRVRAELNTLDARFLALGGERLRATTVPAGGETALEWTGRAQVAGLSTLRFGATAEKIDDAMETKLPIKEDGFLQASGIAGRVSKNPWQFELTLPTPLDPARTTVEFQVAPGLTPSLVQALPYLIDYPYGCVEQTVSRFLPAAVVAKLLRDHGFDAADVEKHLFPLTAPGPPGRASAAGLSRLDAVIAQSLAKLQEAAHGSGGFGWFPAGEVDAYMTAYVLRGLNVAAAAGIALPRNLHRETYAATLIHLAKGDPQVGPQQLAWILDAATSFPEPPDDQQRQIISRTFEGLYAERSALGASGLALLAQVAHALHREPESAVLRRNLGDGVTRARSTEFGETAHWGKSSAYYDGLDGEVEATALALQALLALDPKDELVDAAASWLLLNRQSGRWNNTRDTALAVLALHDYARARGETTVQGGYRLLVNGRLLSEKRFDRTARLAPITVVADAAHLQPGKNQIVVERTGADSACYVVATTRSWAQAEQTTSAGSFIKVSREFVRLAEHNTVIGSPAIDALPLPALGGAVLNQERVECRLTIEVPHDLDYVVIESPKAGGCEPLNPLSGWDAHLRRLEPGTATTPSTPRDLTARPDVAGAALYREEHDDRSVFFLPHLRAGRWEIRYTLRALFGGDFRVLPATAEAIYVPAIAGNTAARRLSIE